jgi:hypothetical protein
MTDCHIRRASLCEVLVVVDLLPLSVAAVVDAALTLRCTPLDNTSSSTTSSITTTFFSTFTADEVPPADVLNLLCECTTLSMMARATTRSIRMSAERVDRADDDTSEDWWEIMSN